MANLKAQKEVDKAVKHLIEYINKSPEWSPRFDELMDQFFVPVANHFDEDIDAVASRLFDGPYGDMTFGFLFEEMATTLWNNETQTPIDDFLKERGWREGPRGRRYLRAMNASNLQFYEITNVEPGRWVDVRLYGTDSQSQRVLEKAASESLHQWDCIVARVLNEGKTRKFTGSILPLTPDAAKYVQGHLACVADDLADIYQEMVDEGNAEGTTVNLVDEIPAERLDRLTQSSFSCWAIDALEERTGGTPQMFNTDNERIVITKFRFPITGEPSTIAECLSAHPAINEDTEHCWSWIKSNESNTVLGRLWLDDKNLLFETNSVERSKLGVNLISSLLGDDVGQPMGVHENLDDLMASMPATDPSPPSSMSSADLQAIPEVRAMLQQTMKAHYLKTLDEPVPMLDNDSPRECAADPGKHDKVVAWLKTLENMDGKSPGPAQDFVWMWEELGLSEYRQIETE